MPHSGETLGYASAGVKSAPPRTLLRIALRFVGRLLLLLIRAGQLLILISGYLTLGLAVAARHVVSAVGRTLLTIGRLRWSDLIRAWSWLATRIVRPWNRATILGARLVGRGAHIPLAATHAQR